MKNYISAIATFTLGILFCCGPSQAEDIDIFAGTTTINTNLPNVIFVLDNTSNWSSNSQQWPDPVAMGQSEAKAIWDVVSNPDLAEKINVGLMTFVSGQGTANYNGGQVWHHLQELNAESLERLEYLLIDRVYNNFTDTAIKRNSNEEFGNLMYDVYNYLDDGDSVFDGARHEPTISDPAAYDSEYDNFNSPLTDADACADTYVIFVGNPNSSGPRGDDGTNSGVLEQLYADLGQQGIGPDALAGSGSGSPLVLDNFEVNFVPNGDPIEVGTTEACYHKNKIQDCTTAENEAGGMCDGFANCSCVEAVSSCGGAQRKYNVERVDGKYDIVLLDGNEPEIGRAWNLDDWTKFLYDWGVGYTTTLNPGTDDEEVVTERINVKTYTIDVFNAQPNKEHSALLKSAADVGGGRYFQANNGTDIQFAIESALQEILSENSSFAAVTLPISSTNRAQADNQVFIGMFRPTQGKKPRWFGNLKNYQLANFNNKPELADANLYLAVNTDSGYISECAESFWSSDTEEYWNLNKLDVKPITDCIFTENSPYSDLPDGPFVEKGGVAQQTRELARNGGERNLYTINADVMELWSDANTTTFGSILYSYLLGDTAGETGNAVGEYEDMPATGLRPSIHGDVVHSRPLSIRYASDSVKVFYGSNDGMFRMIDAETGAEDWSLVAPEHYAGIQRLYENSPLIAYEGITEEPGYTYENKDYFFDGSSGQLVEYSDAGDLSRAYIFPTMRRGGRMIYALDVTSPSEPSLLWSFGCPNLDNDTGCSGDEAKIGQTWSFPIAGYVSGYDDEDPSDPQELPIAIFGGGFDECLNEDVAALPADCGSGKGRAIYVLDATNGTVLATYITDAPVVAEMDYVDINFDGLIDYAYAVDAAGNLYRVDFSVMTGADPETQVTGLDRDDWEMNKIASTPNNNDRRFFSAPALGALKGTVVIAFGSGDRERPLEANYPWASSVQNRFYTLFDRPYEAVVSGGIDMDDTINFFPVVQATVLDPDEEPETVDLEAKNGWYMDLSDRGEQVPNPAAIGGGKVFFNSFQPGGASNGLCSKPLGIGTGYAVDVFSPVFTEGNEIASGGIPIPPIIATVSIPPGRERCVGDDCEEPDPIPNCPGHVDCETITVCVGCEGYRPVEIIPEAPPIRRRMYYTENMDAAL